MIAINNELKLMKPTGNPASSPCCPKSNSGCGAHFATWIQHPARKPSRKALCIACFVIPAA